MKKKQRSPSRDRYEKKKPTFSARVTRETHERLCEVLPKLGMSRADALGILAGKLEIKAIPVDEARRQGYEEAKKLYSITYRCCVCGKPIVITNPGTKMAVSRFLITHGWGHKKCIEQTGDS